MQSMELPDEFYEDYENSNTEQSEQEDSYLMQCSDVEISYYTEDENAMDKAAEDPRKQELLKEEQEDVISKTRIKIH